VGSRSGGVIPSAGHPAYFDQLAATVEEIGRLSALRTPVVVVETG
jgi:hypothetical protein